MGSDPSRESIQPEWPRYSQEMRGQLYPELSKGVRGELTRGQEIGMRSAEDEVRAQTSISREQLLRDMGRMPGVPGPERYEGLRRLQDQQIRGIAGIEAKTRIGAQQQAIVQALQYAMQAPGRRGEARGEKTSTGTIIGRAIGGMAVGGAGMMMGGAVGGGGTGTGMTSVPGAGGAGPLNMPISPQMAAI